MDQLEDSTVNPLVDPTAGPLGDLQVPLICRKRPKQTKLIKTETSRKRQRSRQEERQYPRQTSNPDLEDPKRSKKRIAQMAQFQTETFSAQRVPVYSEV